jgi:hypothetical protein
VFFYVLLVFYCPTSLSSPKPAITADDICITGFSAPQKAEFTLLQKNSPVQNGYEQLQIADVPEALVQTPIRRWFSAQRWQAGYALWQESRRCDNTFGADTNFVCKQNTIARPAESECQGTRDGYEFLVMHRYLLQTIRALWPQLDDPFSGWRQFPKAEDYPAFLQPRFYAWPNGVLNKVPNIGGSAIPGHGAVVFPDENAAASRREQLLERWKTEGEFGQWLQCGTTQNGLGIDSLYGALITNAMPLGDRLGNNIIYPMDLYLFWKNHGWIDQMWEDYRRALGKTPEDPELQAALIQQCQIHNAWAEKSRDLPTGTQPPENDDPLYWNGELNPHHVGKLVRLMGEIVDIRRGPNNKIFIQIDMRLVGVNPIWVSSFSPVAEGILKLGATYEFVGTVATADTLDASGRLRKFLQSPTLLVLKSLQSPK